MLTRGAHLVLFVVTYLASRAVVALLVAAAGAGVANDNHAIALAAVLEGGHIGGLSCGCG